MSQNSSSPSGPPRAIKICTGWQMWPWVWLRGAGFPAEKVLLLEASRSISQLNDYLLANAKFAESCDRACQALRSACELLNRNQQRPFQKALIKLGKGNVPAASQQLSELAPHLEAARAHQRIRDEILAKLATTYEDDCDRISERLALAVCDRRFREAIAWQNPQVLNRSIDKLQGNARVSHQRLAASYLQRYCTKNDTIGFFGPVTWGHIVEDLPLFKPGPTLLSRRQVFFSAWAIEKLAQCLSADAMLKPHLNPRCLPTVHVLSDQLLIGTTRIPVDREIAWLLAKCTGDVSARELASEALGCSDLNFDEESEVFDLLEELEDKPLLQWKIEIPFLDSFPERYLRQALQRAGETGREGLTQLDRLECGRETLARCAGDADATIAAREALDSVFEEITSGPSSRNAGATYGGRAIVFEDCVRDYSLRLPAQHMRAIGPALSLALASARWCSHEIAKRYRISFLEIHRELGGGTIPYLQFFAAASETLPSMIGAGAQHVGKVMSELRTRWERILGLPTTQRRVSLSSEDLVAATHELFAAPHPGWPTARFHSPDLLFSCSTLEQAESHSLQVVLGELHACTTTVFAEAVTHHDCPILPDVIKHYEQHMPVHIETVVPNARASRATGRSMSSRDYQVEIGSSKSANPRSRVIAASNLVVEKTETSLRVRTRDSEHSFDVIAFFEYQLAGAVASRFGFLHAAAHSPRVQIDNLVIARESWRFDVASLAFAARSRGIDQFRSTQEWRREHDLPRFLFAKASAERKPLFVDLDSPLTIELLCNQLRKSKSVQVSEMLPNIHDNWLRDHDGHAYTSELRTVVVDDTPWLDPH